MVDCIGVPEIGIDDWVKALLPRWSERLPLMGSLELTYRCNLECVQCYCNLPPHDQKARSQELSLAEIRDMIDQVADEGCLWLLLTGGEPLLRPDFLEVYQHAKRAGMLVTLFTNGTLVNAEIADYLAEWPPRKVEITLHGVTRETFERVTRVAGSYDRCMRGIQHLLERDVPLSLKTTVTRLNLDELWETKEYVEGLGVKHRFDAMLIPRFDGSKQPYEVRLSPEELVQLDMADEERWRELERLGDRLWGVVRGDDLYVCGAGERSFHIDPYGRLGLCTISRAHTYDLRQGSFRAAWTEFIPGVRSLKMERVVPCRTCLAIALCGQCPAWSYLEHRDLYTPSAYVCAVGRARAEALGKRYEMEEYINEKPRSQEAIRETVGHQGKVAG
jgi:radical SAM protein with 4Fe4S-binding SPASM domain